MAAGWASWADSRTIALNIRYYKRRYTPDQDSLDCNVHLNVYPYGLTGGLSRGSTFIPMNWVG
jgi:hypothetical protein